MQELGKYNCQLHTVVVGECKAEEYIASKKNKLSSDGRNPQPQTVLKSWRLPLFNFKDDSSTLLSSTLKTLLLDSSSSSSSSSSSVDDKDTLSSFKCMDSLSCDSFGQDSFFISFSKVVKGTLSARKAPSKRGKSFCLDSHEFHAIGVADGVSQWRQEKVDSRNTSFALMHENAMFAKHRNQFTSQEGIQTQTKIKVFQTKKHDTLKICILDFPACNPTNIIQQSFVRLNENKVIKKGSSTSCVAILNPIVFSSDPTLSQSTAVLSVSNVGDSGLMIFRNGKIVFGTVRASQGDGPEQISFLHNMSKKKKEEYIWTDLNELPEPDYLLVQEGDVIVLGSDGLFDNLSDISFSNAREHWKESVWYNPQLTQQIAGFAEPDTEEKKKNTFKIGEGATCAFVLEQLFQEAIVQTVQWLRDNVWNAHPFHFQDIRSKDLTLYMRDVVQQLKNSVDPFFIDKLFLRFFSQIIKTNALQTMKKEQGKPDDLSILVSQVSCNVLYSNVQKQEKKEKKEKKENKEKDKQPDELVFPSLFHQTLWNGSRLQRSSCGKESNLQIHHAQSLTMVPLVLDKDSFPSHVPTFLVK